MHLRIQVIVQEHVEFRLEVWLIPGIAHSSEQGEAEVEGKGDA